jgi:hypothetical protein
MASRYGGGYGGGPTWGSEIAQIIMASTGRKQAAEEAEKQREFQKELTKSTQEQEAMRFVVMNMINLLSQATQAGADPTELEGTITNMSDILEKFIPPAVKESLGLPPDKPLIDTSSFEVPVETIAAKEDLAAKRDIRGLAQGDLTMDTAARADLLAGRSPSPQTLLYGQLERQMPEDWAAMLTGIEPSPAQKAEWGEAYRRATAPPGETPSMVQLRESQARLYEAQADQVEKEMEAIAKSGFARSREEISAFAQSIDALLGAAKLTENPQLITQTYYAAIELLNAFDPEAPIKVVREVTDNPSAMKKFWAGLKYLFSSVPPSEKDEYIKNALTKIKVVVDLEEVEKKTGGTVPSTPKPTVGLTEEELREEAEMDAALGLGVGSPHPNTLPSATPTPQSYVYPGTLDWKPETIHTWDAATKSWKDVPYRGPNE